MRFRLADFTALKSIAKQTATGMVVAMEVTSTSTRVTYQCREGYEIGKHFCKEGGICCGPYAENKCNWEPGYCEMMCSSGYYFDRTQGKCAFWEAGSCCSGPPFKTLEECQKYCGGDSGFCGSSTQGPCASDSECITGGCSGQVCQSIKEQSVPTTCEYKDCYNAEKYGMKCRCIHESITPSATAAIIGESSIHGRCKWAKAETTQYCKDSDNGWNQYIRGTAATSSGISKTDECAQCTGACEPGTQCPPVYCGAVVEYACKEGEIKQETFQCPNGCKEGACIKETTCRSEGEFCGGIAAIQCCSGLTCQLDGTYPDAGGKCVKAAIGYRNAYWTCYDGNASDQGGPTSCKSYETWKQYAEEFCKGRCTSLAVTDAANTGVKCGVNTFNVLNECTQAVCTADAKICPDGSTVGRIQPNCDFAPCPAVNVTCTDSDGGKSYYQQGTAENALRLH
jgi:eight-cysteine-cluster-containing protein